MTLDLQMQLGVLVAGAHPAPDLVELARISRDHGYRRLWHADERFFRDPFATLGHLAAAVPDLDLGVAVTDPYVRHPALTARAAATLAEIAPGRFTLGLGAGISGLEAMRIQRRSPLTAMRETVELLRALWGEPGDLRRGDRRVRRLATGLHDGRPATHRHRIQRTEDAGARGRGG